MAESLLKQLQDLTERTYQISTDVNLEHFIIGPRRFSELNGAAGAEAQLLSHWARVFFRPANGRLRLAIYYADFLIDALERQDPRRGLSERNIREFAVFVEEIAHAVHGASRFLECGGLPMDEWFVRDLELTSKVDTYMVLKFFMVRFNASGRLEAFDRLWLRHHCFEVWDGEYNNDLLQRRYHETNELGLMFSRFLEALPEVERLDELRRFRGLSYPRKKAYVAMLP